MKKNNILTLAPYLGGKARLFPVLSELIDKAQDTDVFGELFGGMGAVLLNKAAHPHEIYNEFSPSNYSIFKCLATPELADSFIDEICVSDYDEETYRKYRARYERYFFPTLEKPNTQPKQGQIIFDSESPTHILDVGVASLILVKLSYAGLIRHSSFMGFRDGKEGQQYDNWKLRLPDIAERLTGVEIMNRDALEIIKEHADDPNYIFLCDPPYYGEQCGGEGENYTVDWGKREHEEFLALVRDVKCKLIICNYQSEDKLYDKALCAHGWQSFCIGELTKNAKNNGLGERRDRVEEWVWINYEI